MEENRRLECPHCGKRYRVQPGQIPEGTKAIRCQACGKGIPVESVVQPRPASGPTVILACSDCGKRYRVPEARIPSGRSEVPCKACGGSVPLPGAEPDFDEIPQWDTDTDLEAGDAHDTGGMDPSHVRVLRTAIGGGVLVLVLLIGLGVYYMWPRAPKTEPTVDRVAQEERDLRPRRTPRVKDVSDRDDPEPTLPVRQERSPKTELDKAVTPTSVVGTSSLEIDPFWAGCIDLQALITQARERGGVAFLSDPNVPQALFMVQAMGLKDLQWAVYRQGGQLGLAACLRVAQARQLEAMMLGAEPLDPNIEHVEMHHYRLAAELTEGLACDDIDLMFAEDAVWLTSASLLETCLQDAQALAGLALMQQAQACRGDCHCVTTALAPPEKVRQWVTGVMQAMQEQTEDFSVLMTLGMIESMIAPCYTPLEQLESLAMGVGLPAKGPGDPNLISASLNLTLRDEAVTRQALEVLQQEELEVTDLSWGSILRQMSQSNQTRQVEQVGHAIHMAWSLDLDQCVAQAMGPGEGMDDPNAWDDEVGFMEEGNEPDPFELDEEVEVTPPAGQVSENPFFQAIQEKIEFDGIDKGIDEMELSLSLEEFPALEHADMSQLTYRVLAVETADGSTVLQKRVQGELEGRQLTRSWSLDLPLRRDSDTAQIRSVTMQLTLTVPVSIETVTLDAKTGATAQQGTFKAEVIKCGSGNVSLQYRGGRNPLFRLYDAEGQRIRPNVTGHRPRSRQLEASFKGKLGHIELTFVRQTSREQCTLVVPIGGVDQTRPTQYDPEPFPEAVAFDFNEVTSHPAKVTAEQLVIPGSAGWPVRVSCEVYPYERQDKELAHPERVEGAQEITYRLPPAAAWYGAMVYEGPQYRERLEATDPGQRKARLLKRLGGQCYSVRFEGQDVSVVAEKGQVIRIAAYDQTGQRLTLFDEESESSFSSGTQGWEETKMTDYQFCGVPVRVVLDVLSQERVKKRLPVDARLERIDLTEYAAFKKRIDPLPRVMDALTQAAKLRNVMDYGDDLAGLYYLNQDGSEMSTFYRSVRHEVHLI